MGLDVGDRFSQLCVVDQDGVVIQEDRIPTTRVALRERLAGPPARVVLEAGTHAGWMSRELTALGHEVLVANSRKLRWLYHNEHKTGRVDATYLGRDRRWAATLLAPSRVRGGRAVGAYFGLCPRRADSGAHRPQLGITKCGDGLVRQLLVQAAHYILGPFGPDCRLRRWGLELARRGGKNAKKRAIIAVARKLAALLYSLWVHDTRYAP